jgi:glycosidase
MPADRGSDRRVHGVPGNLFPYDFRFDPAEAAHCCRLDEETILIRVLAEPGFEEGLVVTRSDGSVARRPMTRTSGTGRFAVWECRLADPGRPLEYSFAFRTGGRTAVYLAPSGVTNAIERLDRWSLDPAALVRHDVPAWAEGAVVYQIFPDRFAVGDPEPNPPGSLEWGAPPDPVQFHGGDLAGIRNRVDVLANLGIEAVYLNPIFTSPSNHRYDTIDYHEVDPVLGGNQALAELVEVLHGRGIRVILDVSLNHCHPRFFAFADVVENGPASAYADWFRVDEYPPRVRFRPHAAVGEHADWMRDRAATLAGETGLAVEVVEDDGPVFEPTYDAWYGVPTMPRVDLQHPEARRFMLDVATHWVSEYGIDGWRMDVTRYVDLDFWNDFRKEVRAVKPGCYLVAEVMGDARQWLQGDRFDATMNYTFRDLCVDYFATGRIDTGRFLDGFTRMLAAYSPAVTGVNLNLLSSHDTARFLTVAGNDRRRLLAATLFQLTVPGTPSIYYGDEVGMTGGDDPDSRGTFPTELPAEGEALRDAIRTLVSLRRSRQALRRGSWELSDEGDVAFSFLRRWGEETLAVGINTSDEPVTLRLGAAGSAQTLWGAGTMTIRGGEAWVELPPVSGTVVEL